MAREWDWSKNMKNWPLPETTTRADGEPRRVGVEIELGDIPVQRLGEIVADVLGGKLVEVSSVEYRIEVRGSPDYRIEVDLKILKKLAREKKQSGNESVSFDELLVNVLSSASTIMVPCEIVSPPIPMNSLAEPIDAIVDAVRMNGGKGTRQSVLYAFGVHLNVEPPRLDAETIAAFLKAFACLYDWIVWKGDVDLIRRFTPYIDRYPRDYESLLCDPGYWPDVHSMIDDYLAANPTRNRGLDMMPMFAYLEEERVSDAVDDPLIKARPAFHYRLANSCVDEPDWSVVEPWCRWLAIETLAADRETLDEICQAFASDRERVLSLVDNRWREESQKWLASDQS